MNDIIYVQHLLISCVFIYRNFHRNDNSKERDMEKEQIRNGNSKRYKYDFHNNYVDMNDNSNSNNYSNNYKNNNNNNNNKINSNNNSICHNLKIINKSKKVKSVNNPDNQ